MFAHCCITVCNNSCIPCAGTSQVARLFRAAVLLRSPIGDRSNADIHRNISARVMDALCNIPAAKVG
jgi:hypothetical protein